VLKKKKKKGREKAWESENIEARTQEEDKSKIFRRQEEDFDQQRQGIVRIYTCTLTPLFSLVFLISYER